MLEEASSRGCELVVFLEFSLTTFFPRWYIEDQEEIDAWFETEMPSPATKPLFERAQSLGVGFSLGYAELTSEGHHCNTQVLVDGDGEIVAKVPQGPHPGARRARAMAAVPATSSGTTSSPDPTASGFGPRSVASSA